MDTKRFEKKKSQCFEALKRKSPLSRIKRISEGDLSVLGKMFEQYNQFQSFMEANGAQAASLGPLPVIALDCLTSFYGASCVPVMCSIQPIDAQKGYVYFKQRRARYDGKGGQKGNVKDGDLLRGLPRHPDVYAVGYAGEKTAFKAQAAEGEKQAGTIPEQYLPIRPYSLKVSIPSIGALGSDDGTGRIMGSNCFGTIDYVKGAYTLTTYKALAAKADIDFEFGMDYEQGAPIPKVSLETDSKDVSAEIFTLGMQIGLFKKFELMKRFGERAVDEEINTLSNELIMEIGQTAITRANAASIGERTFSCKPSEYYSIKEKLQGLKVTFAQGESTIIDNAGTGAVTNIIAGADAYAIVKNLDGFKSLNVTATGPHLAGTLDDAPVIRVPKLPGNNQGMLKGEEILLQYKGPGDFDANVVWAPYMPLVVTSNLLPMNNPLIEQGVCASWGAVDVTVPAYATKVKLTDIPALLDKL